MEIQLWKEILEPYGQAVDELVVKFNHIKREYQNGRMYSPIESVSGRVKSISSIMEKAQRKNVKIEEIEEKIEDIAVEPLQSNELHRLQSGFSVP